ncbi:hypothetical protein AtubIFM55763_009713 [Aspergillus tubingensis]|uniref:Uncharacterized protein n=1 Tax=Aspergillus tubingensis TaxID=5068 RepID=A0A8H3XY04_ASPTU|nr:uncharacterized protein AtWU_05091 [Aspergillus tubingensis]GFN15290.1 hypothetical protein AtWU_05091 [Aspergillus tubingensis]GLA77526.1 hypothetical protein AtubIFM55763_009713 [Aspergillus tubingensis]GLA88663.1 hypothetical protein AtubIFM56815_003122 [Aspergillus tubingensis]GLA91867.1 hypothetical protein AtubIFM57143_006520 [Aspergillus tubingensis]
MKFTTALGAFALIATANAAVTGYCTPGFNYCDGVLDDVGDNDAAIMDALRRFGDVPDVRNRTSWRWFLFHCNDDHSLTVVERCYDGCQNNGKGNTDTCRR